MTKPKCSRCDDTGWVCENHRNLPWGGASKRKDACSCGGAGAPCPDCNPCDRDNPPDTSRAFKTIVDPDGWRH